MVGEVVVERAVYTLHRLLFGELAIHPGAAARFLHNFSAVVAAHLAECLVAVHDGVVYDLRVRQ